VTARSFISTGDFIRLISSGNRVKFPVENVKRCEIAKMVRGLGRSVIKQGRRLRLNGFVKQGRRAEWLGIKIIEHAKRISRNRDYA
jgi:hypothetical protein